MKIGGGFIACWILFFFLVSPITGLANEYLQVIVTKVIDGDSIVIRYQDENLQVRLWGIDAPEWQQPFSQKAKKFTREKLKGRSIKLYPKSWDKYGRLVAMVWIEEKLFNLEIIKNGLAWVHIYYCKEKICTTWKDVESAARRNGVGLWADAKPVPPWIWKRKKTR